MLQTGINTLEGLKAVSHSLTSLTVISGSCHDIDRKLSSIEPVFLSLSQLRYLNLGDNNISRIENLQNCSSLQQLYLYNNQITKMENLKHCPILEELNLSGNKISRVENVGNYLLNLRVLRLSANPIEFFQDINEISQLPNLRVLSFDCDDFGPCPVTDQDNYREYILCQLTQFQVDQFEQLDRVKVQVEEIEAAKKVFYD